MRFLWAFIFCSSSIYAQQVYWVSFTQKDTSFSIDLPQQFLSEKAIQRRQKFQIPIQQSDLPVSEVYLGLLNAKGFVVLGKSKWLNGAAVVVPKEADLDTLTSFYFVNKPVLPLGKYSPPQKASKRIIHPNEYFKLQEAKQPQRKKNTDSSLYGKAFNQVAMLQTQRLHEQGYKGEGVDIAIIDAGFTNADTLLVFKQLRAEHRIKATYDFVQHNREVYEDDDHGLAVLSCMAGYLPNEYIGTAPNANYYLLRSEYAQTEMPVEEVYWIAAIEYADSAGVDLVNSSLGYNEFDDISLSHSAKDLDGKTTMISRAAAIAVQKGMVVVVSAGNEGDEEWKFISVPADVEEVITVGGVDASRFFVGFSSIGTANRKRIKPDIMAQADNVWIASPRGVFYQGDGTSYSSPIMAGSIACLMQAYPDKTPSQLMAVLHQSGSLYYQPDRYFGYGIPDMQLAFLILQHDTTDAVLDIRVLDDNRIHMVYRSFVAQKITVKVTNEMGVEILNETVGVKNGTTRFALKKIKQFQKGKYSLQLMSEQGTKQFNFNKP